MDSMTQCDATLTSQKLLYTRAAIDLMRVRIEELRSRKNDPTSIQFLGRNFPLVQELHRLWDALPERSGVPHPCDVWSWL
jgi:hypothetical protein